MFAVMAEMHDGSVHRLRGGFETREAAEDHPVKLKYWKRVWIDNDPRPLPPARRDYAPPFPWEVEWAGGHTYVRDSEGRRFAILLGTIERREKVADILCSLGGAR